MGPRPFFAGLLVTVLIAGACSESTPPTPPSPKATMAPVAPSPGGGGVNRALGIGEVREPQPFTLDQRLLAAVSQKDRVTIERALELGANIRAKDDLGRSTLFLAVMDAHDLELVRWLHEKGVPVDEPDVSQRTPLSFAADDGDLPIVRYLVENGAVVDGRDFQQRTPLAHAVGAGHADVVAVLADHGADVNARDQFGDTPLIVACAKGHAAVATLLLAHGADATAKDQEGRTAKERSAPETAPCLALPK